MGQLKNIDFLKNRVVKEKIFSLFFLRIYEWISLCIMSFLDSLKYQKSNLKPSLAIYFKLKTKIFNLYNQRPKSFDLCPISSSSHKIYGSRECLAFLKKSHINLVICSSQYLWNNDLHFRKIKFARFTF